jgi:LacI family transcriptional regulator
MRSNSSANATVRRKSKITNTVTINQVAERAGVSTATVSRVLADTNEVSGELEKRVRKAVRELDYHPNRAARNLRRRITQIVGVVISDIQNPFFTSVVRGIEKVLEEEEYTLLLCNSDEDPRREQIQLSTLRAEGVAGIILAPTVLDSEHYRKGNTTQTALVMIDRHTTNGDFDSVTVDNQGGALSAVNHLISQGHQRIGLVSGPDGLSTAFERKQGYLQAIQAAGLPFQPEYIQSGDFRQQGGYRAMQKLIDLSLPPTAVVVSNNLMTLGAMQAIHERHLSIPREIAVVGFDDMSWATSLQPPLTVISQPTYDLGATAAKILLERIKNPDGPIRQIVLDTALVIRASSTK